MNISKQIQLSDIFLIYGLFSVLCHTVWVLFCALSSEIYSSALLIITYVPILEYSVISLALVFGGALLIKLTERDIIQNKK